MAIHMIVAMTKDRVIGKPKSLPWHISEDLKRFKKLTTGHTVIMGMRTFESIGKPLPDRNNIVLNLEKKEIDGVTVCTSIDEAMALAKTFDKEIFIIGGASIYEQMLPLVEILHISHVKKDYEGSIYFPEYDLDEWKDTDREEYDEFTAVTYKRVKHAEPA